MWFLRHANGQTDGETDTPIAIFRTATAGAKYGRPARDRTGGRLVIGLEAGARDVLVELAEALDTGVPAVHIRVDAAASRVRLGSDVDALAQLLQALIRRRDLRHQGRHLLAAETAV